MNLKFRYTNWRHQMHDYVVEPQDIVFLDKDGPYPEELRGHWVLNAYVVTRDGDPRDDMGSNRRRTFLLTRLMDLQEIERSA